MNPLPHLYLISDGARLGRAALLERVAAAHRGGLELLQLRERHLDDGSFAALARAIQERLPGLRLIANRRAALVERLDLEGLHVGGEPVEVARARDIVGAERRVGYSAHSVDEARCALELGADYVSLSPVFPPRSKRAALETLGPEGFAAARARLTGFVYALGGVGPENIATLQAAGATGVGVIGAILDAPDPALSTRELLAAWCASAARRDSARALADWVDTESRLRA